MDCPHSSEALAEVCWEVLTALSSRGTCQPVELPLPPADLSPAACLPFRKYSQLTLLSHEEAE